MVGFMGILGSKYQGNRLNGGKIIIPIADHAALLEDI